MTANTSFAPSVDFSAEAGHIRPELHSSGFGPTICSLTAQALEDIKSMGFKMARTHDWALINANERVCDYFHIFPLMHLDASNPENYHFAPTDYLLKRTREEAGLDVFYRLGTSIEHSGKAIHFNSLIPDDFEKVAETFAGTVRHYNRGWANGFHWNIRYWEIWNEPEGINNMWCPKESLEGLSNEELRIRDIPLRAKFVEFFVLVLKRLKREFGDEIRVGGPALCGYNTTWLNDLLSACQKEGIAPDFISWHGYTNNPTLFKERAEAARELCDSYGFTKCELIVNEWHYFGENYNWTEMQLCSDPMVKARIWDGPDSHNGIRSACFTLACLSNMQCSKLDQAYYYGCRHTGAWGFKDELQKKYKVFYALKLFGDLVKKYSIICGCFTEGTVTAFAVRNEAGKKALLVVDYGGATRTISIAVNGVSEKEAMNCTLLDYHHDLTDHEANWVDGKLELVKPDFHSAAFLVEWAPDCP